MGLWLSSLCFGYLVMLSQALYTPFKVIRGIFTEKQRFPWRSVVLGVGAVFAFFGFILAFFTFHFGAFHYAHGFILEGFFPIEGMSYPSGVFEFVSFVGALVSRYYGMVLASVLVQHRMILKPKGLEHMSQPYRGVIKMHLMIFVFVGLSALGATNFLFYAATLFVCFFPWRVLRHEELSDGILDTAPVVTS